jgi:hypothetical protein
MKTDEPVARNAASSTVAPLTWACGPTMTWSLIEVEWRSRPRTTACSMTIVDSPISTGPPSAVTTAPKSTRASSPSLTSPQTTAFGAT